MQNQEHYEILHAVIYALYYEGFYMLAATIPDTKQKMTWHIYCIRQVFIVIE